MSVCRLCMLRCIRGRSSALKFHSIGNVRPLIGGIQLQSQSYNTFRITRSAVPSERTQDGYRESPKSTTRGQALKEIPYKGRGIVRKRRQTLSKGKDAQEMEGKRPLLKSLKKGGRSEALQDPLQLAEYVRSLLAKGRFVDAEDKVRRSSNTINCVVSWNHLIDWQLTNGKLNGAVKTYNEMKKRAQAPDAHTFTILFRGMAANSEYKTTLAKALSIYHAMDADNSPVQPNIIHTNAVLKVCARAGDMDAMFGIAAKLRGTGLRAPNNLTYTTIFNAIREHAAGDGNISEADLLPIRTKSIQQARVMWADIISRWRNGDMWIDEELVCSMGRVLLLGTKKDVDDVFSLLEQTMNIRRMMPKYGSSARRMIEPGEQGQRDSTTLQLDESDESRRDLALAPEDNFAVLLPPPQRPKGLSAFATPGRNSLSLVLDTLMNLNLKKFAADYWEIFTRTNNVAPDSNNFHSYLRLLRVARASTEAVELLQKMPKAILAPKTFRISMAACVRDKNNPNAFANSGKILDLMQQHLSNPDIVTLISYLEVAARSPAYSSKAPSDGIPAESKNIQRALARLEPSFINIKTALASGTADHRKSGPKNSDLVTQSSDMALTLTKMMVSCYDKLLMNRIEDEKLCKELKQERSKLAAFVTKYTFHRPAAEVGLSAEEGKKMWRLQEKKAKAKAKEVRVNVREARAHPDAEEEMQHHQEREGGAYAEEEKHKWKINDQENPSFKPTYGYRRLSMAHGNADRQMSQERIPY